MALVHVLTFAPAHAGGTLPGFDWAPASDSGELTKDYYKMVEESSRDGSLIVRLLELKVNSRISDEESVIDEIDDILASNHGRFLPALEQYVPENADPSLKPDS